MKGEPMQTSLETYEELARKVADARNDRRDLEADHIEQQFKVLRSREDGWHPHSERRCGDALRAQLVYEVAYSNRRR